MVARAVVEPLQLLLEETNGLDSFQSGFTSEFGTEPASVALMDDLYQEKGRGLQPRFFCCISQQLILLAWFFRLVIGGTVVLFLLAGSCPESSMMGRLLLSPMAVYSPGGHSVLPSAVQHLYEAIGNGGLGARSHQYAGDAKLCFSITSDSGEAVKEWWTE